MPIDRATVERFVAKLNAARPPALPVRLEEYVAPGRFVLSFPNRPMSEGQCIDQDFSEIQWALHEEARIDTGIQAGRHDAEADRYHITYEVIEWD